jgi:hypothetical protein
LLATLPEMGLVALPITAIHAAGVTRLPPIHRDPFDRLLIAQSLAEPLTLLTNDALIRRSEVFDAVIPGTPAEDQPDFLNWAICYRSYFRALQSKFPLKELSRYAI